MRAIIDRARCAGHARCAASAPELYTLDDEGYIAVTVVDIADADRTPATRGARACPERVITLEE